MMAKEVYRIEIPIEATDNYSNDIKKAEKDVKGFEGTTKKAAKSNKDLGDSSEKAAKSVNKVGGSAQKAEKDVTKFQSSMRKTESRLKSLASSSWKITVSTVDRASKVISSISSFTQRVAGRSYRFTLRAIDMATSTIRGIGRMITSIPAIITIALSVVGVGKLKDATVGAAMSFEQYEVSMTHWLDGNTEKAKELVKWMGQFADTTPFSSPDLFPALVEGVNISKGDISLAQRYLKIASDMAALTPGRSVEEAMLALSGANTGNFEMMKGFKAAVTQKEFKSMGGWDSYIKMVEKKFKDGAKKLSETSEGILLTLKGYRSSIFRSMGTGFLDPMKPRLDAINNWLANNQEKWGRWKETVKNAGNDASEWLFSRLEKGFNYVKSNYLENDNFKKLDFKGKVNFVMDDVGGAVSEWWSSKGKPVLQGWWEGSGKPWAEETGLMLGEAIYNGILTGISKGLPAIGGMWQSAWENVKRDPISKESATSVGGAGIATLGVGALAAMVLSPLLKVAGAVLKSGKVAGAGVIGAGKWFYNKTSGRGKNNTPEVVPNDKKSSGKTNPVAEKQSSTGKVETKPSSPAKTPVILDQYGNPLPPSGTAPTSAPKTSKWKLPKMPKLPKGVSAAFKRVPLLGTLYAATTLASSTKEELPGTVGGLAGGLAGAKLGAMGGAALGSIIPGVGTAVGGVVGGIGGGIIGAIGGEKIMNWIFGPKKVEAATVQPSIPSNPYPNDISGASAGSLELSQSMAAMTDRTKVATGNMEILTSYLAEASNWVVGAFFPLSEKGSRLENNISLLSTYVAQASGWVVSLYGIQEKASSVKSALGNLASRVNNVSVSGTPSTNTPAKPYADGGMIRKPHLGLVGEAGPEMIIPLSSGRRNRAMDLYQRTGQLLGVTPYANGGFVGNGPLVPMDDSPVVTGGGMIGNISVSAPVSVTIEGGAGSFDANSIASEILNQFGIEMVSQLKESLSNMT